VKFAAICLTVLTVAAFAQAPSDSLLVDSLMILPDSAVTDSAASLSSAWLLPLAVIAATGAVFALLFTTRSK